MNHRTRLLTLIPVFTFLTFAGTQERVSAQIGVGGGLEFRSEDPTGGYGIRLEYGFMAVPPLIDLKARLHGSYFFDEKTVRYETEGLQSSITERNAAFDIGAAVVAGVNIGMVKPFAGAGFGVESSEINPRREGTRFSRIKEENMFWNVLFGAELTLLPYIKPFFEYRYAELMSAQNIDFTELERFSLGIIFRF